MTTRFLEKRYIPTIPDQEYEEDYETPGANQLIAQECLGLFSQKNKPDTSPEKGKGTWSEHVDIFNKELSCVVVAVTAILAPIIKTIPYLSKFDEEASEEEFNFLHDYVKDDFSADYFSVKAFDQRIEELRKQHGIR